MEIKTKVILRIICDFYSKNNIFCEKILCEKKIANYTPNLVDSIISSLINEALENAKIFGINDFKNTNAQLSVTLHSDDEIRPAFSLSYDSIKKLYEHGLSFDFDPYV